MVEKEMAMACGKACDACKASCAKCPQCQGECKADCSTCKEACASCAMCKEKMGADVKMAEQRITIISEAVRLSGGKTPTLEGIMLSPGVKSGSAGKRVFTPEFIEQTAKSWVGKPVLMVDPIHTSGDASGARSPTQVVGRIADVKVRAGRMVFKAPLLDTQVARDAMAVAKEFGASVSIEGRGIGKRSPEGLVMQSDGWQARYLTWLMPGEQADAEAIAEVKMAKGALDQLINEDKSEEVKTTDDKEKQEFEAVKLALSKANEELTKAKADIDARDKQKAEVERATVLAEVVALAKELEEPEPKADASVEDLKAAKVALSKAKEVLERARGKQFKPGGGAKTQPDPAKTAATSAERMSHIFR